MSKVGKAAKGKTKTSNNEISEETAKLIAQLNEQIASYVQRHLVPFVKNQDSLEEALDNIMENVKLSIEADVKQIA